MTADVSPLVRIPTPQQIATDPQFTCGTWTDGQGRNLIQFLTRWVGRHEARRILDEAADIADGVRHGVVPPKSNRPKPGVDRVWTDADGVDHDPIPMRQVTVCAAVIPPPFVYQPAGGIPCPDCYSHPGDPS